MKNKSLKKSYFYNIIFTMINMVFPVITAPYLSYILGAENIGKINYATSIINWILIFTTFGIPRYGIREVAKNRNDKENLSNAFWNLLLIQLILSIIAIIIYLYIIFSFDVFRSERILYLMMVIMIILNIFSIDWFYQGIEEYKYITSRNLIIKIFSLIMIFTIINKKEQYLLYALINILALSFNNILNYLNTKKFIQNKITKINILFYLKELKVYFITTFTISIYTQLDQIFIGSLSQIDLAFYVRSKTIFSIGLNILNSLIIVLIPRLAYLFEENFNEYKNILNKSINYIYLIGLPCSIGMISLSREIMIFLGGIEFIPASYSLNIIAILIVINSVGSWQINQVLLPYKYENLALRIQLGGAALSVILNIILIPRYSYIGAAITWIFTETFLVIVEAIVIKRKCSELSIKYFNSSLIKYLISTVIMYIVVLIIKTTFSNNFVIIALSTISGAIAYMISVIILKDNIVCGIVSELTNKYLKRSY